MRTKKNRFNCFYHDATKIIRTTTSSSGSRTRRSSAITIILQAFFRGTIVWCGCSIIWYNLELFQKKTAYDHYGEDNEIRLISSSKVCSETYISPFRKMYFHGPYSSSKTPYSSSKKQPTTTEPTLSNYSKLVPLSYFLIGPGLQRLPISNNNSTSIKTTTLNSAFSALVVKDTNKNTDNTNEYNITEIDELLSQYLPKHVAVCQFIQTEHSDHPPHAFEQLIRCMSFWRTRQLQLLKERNNQQQGVVGKDDDDEDDHFFLPVLTWPSYEYKPGLYSESRSYYKYANLSTSKINMDIEKDTNKWLLLPYFTPKKKNDAFMYGMMKELVQLFHVLVTTPSNIVDDVSHELEVMMMTQQQKMTKKKTIVDMNRQKQVLLHLLTKSSTSSSSSLAVKVVLQKVLNESIVQRKNNIGSFFARDPYNDIPYYTNIIKKRHGLLSSQNINVKDDPPHEYIDGHKSSSSKELYEADEDNRKQDQRRRLIHQDLFSLPLHNNTLQQEQQQQQQQQHVVAATEVGVVPRIGIVNRRPKSYRSIINVDEIQIAIQDQLSIPNVQIIYFEGGKTFLDEITFFSSVDIVISVHGAQLISLLFLPTPYNNNNANDNNDNDVNMQQQHQHQQGCSTVLELFPRRFYVPSFFGRLATSSNIQYYSAYVSTSRYPENVHVKFLGRNTIIGRMFARRINLCPNIHTIIQSIATVIDDWKQCTMNNNNQS